MSELEADRAATRPRRPARNYLAGSVLLTVVVLAALYLLSGIKVIKPEEQALVLRFGRMLERPLLPGTHYVLPYPADRVLVYRPSEVKDVTVGAAWPYGPGEANEASPPIAALGSEFFTGDENIIHIEMNVQYQIGDPAAYLLRSPRAARLVLLACENALTAEVAQTPVDSILTSGRQPLLARVRERAQAQLNAMGVGATLMSMNIARVTPPNEVADAFKDVASALEDRDRFVNEARGAYNEAIPVARGEAATVVQTAAADKNGSVERAKGESARFLHALAELRRANEPSLSVLRLYIETMEKTLPGTRKYIVDVGHK